MRYAKIISNDYINGEGVCVSFWTQGCPHQCVGCHNPETWSLRGGIEDSEENIINTIIEAISANGIQRNFSILGGEPLCSENRDFIKKLTKTIRTYYPTITIFCWTGYLYENIEKTYLENIDVLIDGTFDINKRDITLKLRGSSNQRILNLREMR